MPNHHTRRSTSAQDNPTSYACYSGSARREGTRRKFQFLAAAKSKLSSDCGRETGNFEVVDRQPAVHRVWVCEGTPQGEAWEDHHRANGQRPPKTQRRVGGEQQTGWMFKTEWPPVAEHTPSPEACDE
jgi:hypothetical protein